MADSDIGWLHAQAIAGMLTDLPYPVYVGTVTGDELPYLVLWPPPVSRPVLTLNGYGGEGSTVTQITAAGSTVREVITALDRAGARLHRRRPVIPGRSCSLITQPEGAASPPQPERDEQASTPDRPVYFSFLQFSLFSTVEEL